ncbi:MAG: Glucose-1-phosphate thymidyltransferase [Candidatus Uhrbacteria bacterium GW2011_GWA2_52_8d]|uniref:Glucose-1-phosphate thymidyltransferase n=1 Tax=Candidatus Uhrbacteria bacterium GW2011_GWA2_52_8d TaxID=1618979 RepID=A0A0G1XLE4_9BACT|nr:MAG: Glucose-1-phosphate thymidyltransferase [Candidatus Uhrbacteria bacterium GW2011_GWA2_52_8d]
MKALIAAGGHATRLRPITWTRNKHLIPLANRPMLAHVIDKVVDAGITEIFVNVNPGEVDSMRSALGDGSERGVSIAYIEQQGGARGIAHAVANAEEYLKGDSFIFFLGDNILLGGIRHMRERFEREHLDCLIALSRVKDPQRFGVPELDTDGRVLRMFEKPANPPSPFAVTGIYFFSPEYFSAFKTAKPSARGEYEIMDVINWYIEHRKVGSQEITGWWKDTGTPDALIEGNALIMDDIPREKYCIECTPHEDAQIQGSVSIGEGTTISADCMIRGPVMIGKHCTIESSYIGPYTAIGDEVKIKDTEVEHSIIFNGAVIDTTRRIVNSLIGVNAQLVDSHRSHPKTGHRLVIGDNSFVEL